MIYPPYQVAILSTNYFLWLGLKHAIPYMVCPNPAIQWFNKDNNESVFQLRERIINDDKEAKWLIITEHNRVQEVQQFLPPERACVFSDKLSLRALSQQLSKPDFRRTLRKESPLTQSEIHVCLLIILGFPPKAIADMLHKSPKTIYTHRRNAMTKFHCNTLAELHRKIRSVNNSSLYH